MSDELRLARANALLNDPLNVEFFEKTKESIYSRLERIVDPQKDIKELQNLAYEAIWRSRFIGFYQSFLNRGKIVEFQEKTKLIDRLPRFWPGRKKEDVNV